MSKASAKMGPSQHLNPQVSQQKQQHRVQTCPSVVASSQKGAYSVCSSTTEPLVYCMCNSRIPVYSKQGFSKPVGSAEKHGQGDKKHNVSSSQRGSAFQSPICSASKKNVKPSGKTTSPPIIERSETNNDDKTDLLSKKGKGACFSYMVQCLMPLCKLPVNSLNKPLDPSSPQNVHLRGKGSKHINKKLGKCDALSISLPKHSNMKISIQMLPNPKPSVNLVHKADHKIGTAEQPSKKYVDSSVGTKPSYKHSMCNVKSNSKFKKFYNSQSSLHRTKSSNKNSKAESVSDRSSVSPSLKPRNSCSPCNLNKKPCTVRPTVFHSSQNPDINYVSDKIPNFSKNFGSLIDSLKNYEGQSDFENCNNQFRKPCKNMNSNYCTLDATRTSDSVKRSDALYKSNKTKKNPMTKSKFTGKFKSIPPPVPPPPNFPPQQKNNASASAASKSKGANNSKQNSVHGKNKKTTESHWSRAKRNFLNLNQILEGNENSDKPVDTPDSKITEGMQPAELHDRNDIVHRTTYTPLQQTEDSVKAKPECNQACANCCKISCDQKCSEIYDQRQNSDHSHSLHINEGISKSSSQLGKNGFRNCGQNYSAEKVDIFDCKHSRYKPSLLNTAITNPEKVSEHKPKSGSKVCIAEKFEKCEKTGNQTKYEKLAAEKTNKAESKVSLPYISDTNSSVCFLKQTVNRYLGTLKSLTRSCGAEHS